ncbi:MAG TPA: dicarboxylate/amino acid:cation symporter [Opitutaceae bacterium]
MFIKHPSGDRLATRIMWGLSAGLLLGLLVRTVASFAPGVMGPARWAAIQVLDPFGQVFLRLLFFVIVPLVFSSLALGVVQLGRLDKLGPLAGRTFALFGFNMAVAVALGLVAMNVTSPGEHISTETRDMLLAEYRTNAETIQNRAAEQQAQGFTFARAVDMFMPRNIFAAVVGQSTSQLGEMLPLILLALLVGAAGTTLAQERRDGMQQVLETTTELMTRIVRWALLLAPFAVAALLGSVVIKLGLEILEALIIFCLVVLVSLAVHMFGTMSLLLKVFTRRSPRQFFRAVRAVLVTAFSTSSSAATLPTSIQVTRDQLGVSPSTAGFVLPLGATMNMSGTALYEGCVVLFVAQVYGVDLTIGMQFTMLILTVLSAVAVAAAPGASLPLIVGLLSTFGVPPDGIALVLGVDRLLDMARTTLNVGADVDTACIVDEQARAKNGPAGTAIES